ncbi:hypothetical protein SAMN05444363_2007 [Flavobacterium terrae]|uniref:SMP-30/Gluconolactonase/LRE-like region domain-containing protein n=2 Tax=Flavobacterium terrae TaxID=415425 RepID=A0A1M6EX32_9FLAO|nr:hypothetical protein SAMN05444363_2007 [Flavobacterium terrae]
MKGIKYFYPDLIFIEMKHIYFLLFSFGLLAQSQKEIYLASTKAYENKDYATFLKLSNQLDSLRPSHPTFSYNLACAYALNNKLDKAVFKLKECLLANAGISFEKEPDFKILFDTDEFKQLVDLKVKLNERITTSEKFIELSEKDLHPESLLNLKKTKTWLINSIRNKKIVSFDEKSGKCIDWLTDEKLFSVFAMKADKNERFLWITTSAIPEMKGYSKDLEGKSEILKVDIETKSIVKRFPVQGNHVFGDLVINKNGDIFLSDSGEAMIYQIKNDELSIWLDLKKEAFNLQGITFGKDENELFIADYLKGILKINVQNPSERNWLKLPNDVSKKGIDGFLYSNNSLIVIQNGVKPHRVIQLYLSNGLIVDSKIIDCNRTEMIEPTNGIIKGNVFYFIGNSPWSFYDGKFNLNESKINFPTIYKYNLNAN